MSRSYHITRKAADRAMDEGEMLPTWQASEKAWVKDRVERSREATKMTKGEIQTPNRVVVAAEKKRTRNAIAASRGALDESLQSILARDEPASGQPRRS